MSHLVPQIVAEALGEDDSNCEDQVAPKYFGDFRHHDNPIEVEFGLKSFWVKLRTYDAFLPQYTPHKVFELWNQHMQCLKKPFMKSRVQAGNEELFSSDWNERAVVYEFSLAQSLQ